MLIVVVYLVIGSVLSNIICENEDEYTRIAVVLLWLPFVFFAGLSLIIEVYNGRG